MAYKPVNADDKPKLIIVTCLAVGVFGFGIVRISTGGGQQAQAAKPLAKDSAPQTVSGHPDDFSPEQLLADAVPNPGAGRDPFVSDAALRAATPSVDQPLPGTAKHQDKSLPAPAVSQSGAETLAWNPPVAPLPELKLPSKQASTQRTIQPPPELPDLPACTVKGTLVDGENPVAILEIGSERRFLHIGDALADRFYVKTIRLDGIIVAHRARPSLLIRLRNGKPYEPQSGPAEQTK